MTLAIFILAVIVIILAWSLAQEKKGKNEEILRLENRCAELNESCVSLGADLAKRISYSMNFKHFLNGEIQKYMTIDSQTESDRIKEKYAKEIYKKFNEINSSEG